MSRGNQYPKDQRPEENEEYGVLGRHKSVEDIRREEKEQKEAEKQKRREERAAMKEAVRGDSNTVMWVMVGILGVVVLLVAGLLVFNYFQTKSGEKKEPEENSAHFYRLDDEPEMSVEGIKGVITEAYYTNDKSLAVKLKFSNGLDTEHYLTRLEVTVKNAAGEVIAAGATDQIPDDYYVPALGYNTFTFYITEKYVKIPDDSLESLSYEITTEGSLADSSVSVGTDPTTTTSQGESTSPSTTASTAA